MAIIRINYQEGQKKNLGYKAVSISHFSKNDDEKLFNSGNFVKDWYDCNKFIIDHELYNGPLANSASVDHFIMDGAPYESAYLKPTNNEDWDLFYEYDFQNPGFEFFVEKGTKPSWKELKEICK